MKGCELSKAGCKLSKRLQVLGSQKGIDAFIQHLTGRKDENHIRLICDHFSVQTLNNIDVRSQLFRQTLKQFKAFRVQHLTS